MRSAIETPKRRFPARRAGGRIAALAAAAVLALPAVAGSATDYSKNAATGDFAAAVPRDANIYVPPSTAFAPTYKDYSKNAATGDYAPADTPPPSTTDPGTSTSCSDTLGPRSRSSQR
jgi:hypothetical protein